MEAREQMVARYGFHLSPRRFPRMLAIIVTALLAIHVAFQCYRFTGHEVPFDLYLPFDVDEEPSVPTWYSASALLVAVFLLAAIARTKRREGAWGTWYWYLLAIGFVWLSLDEIAAFHELFNTYSEIEWEIPGAIIAGIVGLVFIPFLKKLPSRTRWLFVISGAIYVTGAAGFEWLGNHLHIPLETLADKLMAGAEEAFEMYAIVIFISALLSYMGAGDASVPLAVRTTDARGVPPGAPRLESESSART